MFFVILFPPLFHYAKIQNFLPFSKIFPQTVALKNVNRRLAVANEVSRSLRDLWGRCWLITSLSSIPLYIGSWDLLREEGRCFYLCFRKQPWKHDFEAVNPMFWHAQSYTLTWWILCFDVVNPMLWRGECAVLTVTKLRFTAHQVPHRRPSSATSTVIKCHIDGFCIL